MKRRLGIFLLFPALLAMAQEAAPERGPLRLSLKRAVELALSPEGNANLQLAGEGLRQAQSRSAQARAALLPDFEAAFGEQNLTRNLAALGLNQARLPVTLPSLVGPFNVVDARISVAQNIFDFSSIRRFQASKEAVRAARSDTAGTEEQVAARVAKAYLAAVRAQADVEASQANIALAEAVLEQARNQKAAGTGTGLEITRAEVQLANEQQRLLVAENQRRATRMRLLREMGLRLDAELELTDVLRYEQAPAMTLEQATEEALRSRPDWKARQQHEHTARLSSSATTLERLPSVAGYMDYGSIGTGLDALLPTRTVGISVKVPIFDGGRRDARRAESQSQYRAEQIRTRDLRDQIELDVRLALDGLQSAEQQVDVAENGLKLAENELTQARRRYDAGVANSLEVTDAQTRVERARDNRIAALFSYNLARLDLGQATGTIRRMIQ